MWQRRSDSEVSSTGAPRQRRRFILAPLLLALVVIAFQYFSAETFISPETGQAVRVALSTDQEQALGLQSFKEVLSQSSVINSGPQYDQVHRVVEKLIPGVDEEARQFEWAVSLINSDQANAFCLPGGKIAVYTGILPITQTDGGLAAVLGHEIAHATLRHGAQRMFKEQMVQTALQGFNGSFSDLDPSQRQTVMALLGAGAQYGLVLPYGRDQESQADEIGLRYLVRAGYDPEEAVRFWERMEKKSDANPPEWASTHPSHGTRIQRLKDLIAKGLK